MLDLSQTSKDDFADAAARPKRKKRSPFCLRLTFEERTRLEDEAGNMAIGAYIRLKLFGTPPATPDGRPPEKPPRRPRQPIKDDIALGRVAGLLGQSRLSQNLNQLAHAVNSGSLPVTPETETALQSACADVARMRHELLRALGKRSDPDPA